HGGVIYLAHPLAEAEVPKGLVQEPLDEGDLRAVATLLSEYNAYFASELTAPVATDGKSFTRLRPASSRPYASMYAN
ncbi:MAG: hypothetical protein LBG81_08220, partial [Coriobacteriaceae bacterium]|nr:hypothetical protein [Coriobacteriaceae bacterium]